MQLVPRQVRICEEVGLMPQHPELREKKGVFIRELFNSLAQCRADSMTGTGTGPQQDRIA